MQIERRYTEPRRRPVRRRGVRPANVADRQPGRLGRLRDEGLHGPGTWSQVAVDILAQKYFRKAGVPAELGARPRGRRARVAAARASPAAGSPARAARPTRARCSAGWPAAGPTGAGRAATSRARTTPGRSTTRSATCSPRRWPRPNSPQWFNTGPALGVRHRGPAAGALLRRPADGELKLSDQRLRAARPARLLHPVASPTTSSTRAASWTCGSARPASSSTAPAPARTSPPCAARASRSPAAASRRGLMSFLKIGDRAAGAIKSGGTTRRAAKMVVLDLDHPDIEEFINWKVVEEQKVAALVAGSRAAQPAPQRHPQGGHRARAEADERFDRAKQPGPAQGHRRRPRRSCPTNYIERVLAAGPAGLHASCRSRSTTPTGTRRRTTPSPARTATTRCASPTTS